MTIGAQPTSREKHLSETMFSSSKLAPSAARDLRAIGMDSDWFPHVALVRGVSRPKSEKCRDSNGHLLRRLGSRVPVLSVGGFHPARTPSELRRATELGLGLSFNLPHGFDIHALDAVLPHVQWIHIGSAGSLTGWGALRSLINAESITLGATPRGALGLEGMVHLRQFEGRGASSVTVAANPNLSELDLNASTWPPSIQIAGKLNFLTLTGNRQLAAMP